MFLKRITNWFKKPEVPILFEMPVDEEEIYKKSKIILQQLDEYITTSEIESENYSIQLDGILAEQDTISLKLKELNKPNSWHERNLLLKLDRLMVHGNNLRQRLELFSQNIKVYLNLMSKVEDIRVMRLNGLETDRIQNIWLEFQNSLETYKEKIATEAVTETKESVTSSVTEERLLKLRHQVFGLPEVEKEDLESVGELEKQLRTPPPLPVRPSLEKVLDSFETDEDLLDDNWNAVKQFEG